MKYFELDQRFIIGEYMIDTQHEILLNLFNELFDSFKEAKGQFIINKILSELNSYTIYHFESEQNFMKELNYPFIREHISEHQYFIMKLNDLAKKYMKKDPSITIETIDFLYEWITNHIMHEDKKIKKYLTQ